jgi:hypothetical protein
MVKKDLISKILAPIGTILVWFPILATLVTGVFGSLSSGQFRMDYLMPAELFPFAFLGGALLLVASMLTRKRQILVGVGYGGAILMLIGGQAAAMVSGLASGQTTPGGWAWVLVISLLVFYILALIVLGVAGILLSRDLFQPKA